MDTQPTNIEGVNRMPQKNNMKVAIGIIVVVLIIVIAFYVRQNSAAATVNGSSISKATVVKELEKQFGRKLLDSLVIEKLVDAEAQKRNITITPDAVDAEIKRIEGQLTAQGTTMEIALATQGLTLDNLKNQIALQKKLEAILSDKLQISDAEIATYIKDNKITVPKGSETAFNDQIKTLLVQQKLATEGKIWIDQAKSSATIKYYGEFQ